MKMIKMPKTDDLMKTSLSTVLLLKTIFYHGFLYTFLGCSMFDFLRFG